MNTNTSQEIIVIDDFSPETIAMLQALYSRSPRSVKEHIAKIKEGGPERFMANFYVGYGHKSIGDCGTTSIFIENVSMLAAKAVQDTPLYNGQEASTRYIDMAGQAILNPSQCEAGQKIQEEWMRMYQETLEVLIPHLKSKYRRLPDEDEKTYEKAIKAKAFDIARGFLPAGATTYVAWHTNLRQAYDHLKVLRHHPLKEIRNLAHNSLAALRNKYPSSFGHKMYESEEEYIEKSQGELAYYDEETDCFMVNSRINKDELRQYSNLLNSRPAKTELPKRLRELGDFVFRFPLDFGSFRDLQRQRSAVVAMPLLTNQHGFFPWYLDQLPEEFRLTMKKKIQKQEDRIKGLACVDKYTQQYYTAMGYTVACKVTASLPSAVYIAELRAGQTVHSTLRVVAQQMTRAIASEIPGIALHSDMSPDEWSVKRGTQDIVKKE